MKTKLLLFFSVLFLAGCTPIPPAPPKPPKCYYPSFPLQEYNTTDINVSVWKEGDENKSFIVMTTDDFSAFAGKYTYVKESLKNLIIDVKTYNGKIQEFNSKD
jgi:hypothetical protein